MRVDAVVEALPCQPPGRDGPLGAELGKQGQGAWPARAETAGAGRGEADRVGKREGGAGLELGAGKGFR